MKPSFPTRNLLDWYTQNKRELPWRDTRDPYTIWISEVILQQTRVAQGLPYFYQFIEAFPTVRELAAAPEQEVLRLWQGLGYYSRARNLLAGARYVESECGGCLPEDYPGLLKIKGIGPYTAAAIASICFDEPVPVVDGNVFRVTARYYGIAEDISRPASKKIFSDLLLPSIREACPGDFNQALMELGATTCTPQSPACHLCPLPASCYAKTTRRQADFPVKSKRVKVRSRYFHYLVLTYEKYVAMKKRTGKDIWQGMFEFWLEESPDEETRPGFMAAFSSADPPEASRLYHHALTHQKIVARFYRAEAKSEDFFKNLVDQYDLAVFSVTDIVDLPKSKLTVNYLTEHEL